MSTEASASRGAPSSFVSDPVAFRVSPFALPAAWPDLPGQGTALQLEGDPVDADFERAGVPLPGPQAGTKRRREYLGGRLAAASALRALGCQGPFDFQPGSDRLPAWPAGMLGSISHSGDAALAWAVPSDRAGGVGIDVEAVMAPERCQRLWRRIAPELAPGRGAAAGLSDEQLLTLVFSAKESLFKALYPGVRRYVGFDAARVERVAEGGVSLQLALCTDWSAEWPAGCLLQAHGHVDAAGVRVMTLLQAPSVK